MCHFHLCWWTVIVMTNEVYSPFLISFRNWIQSGPACHEPFSFKTWKTVFYMSHSRKCRDVWESRVWHKLFLWTLVPYSLLSSEIFLDSCEMLTKLSNEPKMSFSLELGVWSWIDICKIHKRGLFPIGNNEMWMIHTLVFMSFKIDRRLLEQCWWDQIILSNSVRRLMNLKMPFLSSFFNHACIQWNPQFIIGISTV